MISEIEIREHAREHGVPETTIEKDYALNWILKSLNQQTDFMVLKGGTGLRKIYFENYRFSEDLDFTLQRNIGLSELEELIRKAAVAAKKESGINFQDNMKSEENINGFQIDIYFRIFRRGGNPLRIKLDLTKPENEKIVLPPVKRHIFHPYSDKCLAIVMVYSIHEIMAEKLRSIFERTRARDLYDVWFISKNIDFEEIIEIFKDKCKFKMLIPETKEFQQRKENFQSAWKSSLKYQLKDLPEFDPVFSEVMEILKSCS